MPVRPAPTSRLSMAPSVAIALATCVALLGIAPASAAAAGSGYTEPRVISTIEPHEASSAEERRNVRRRTLAEPREVMGRKRYASDRDALRVGDPLPARSEARYRSRDSGSDSDRQPARIRSDRTSYTAERGGYQRDAAADGFDRAPPSPNALDPYLDRRASRSASRSGDGDHRYSNRHRGTSRYDHPYSDGYSDGYRYRSRHRGSYYDPWYGSGYRSGSNLGLYYGYRSGSYRSGYDPYYGSWPYYRSHDPSPRSRHYRRSGPNHYYHGSRDRYGYGGRRSSGLNCFYADHGSRGHSKGCAADMGTILGLFD